MSCFQSSLALHERFFSLITKHFASQFGLRTFSSFLFRSFGRPPCRVPLQEQDKSSDIEQQPPFGDRKISNIQPQNRGGGLQNQQEHHIILTKYEAVHPTAVSENNSSILVYFIIFCFPLISTWIFLAYENKSFTSITANMCIYRQVMKPEESKMKYVADFPDW